MPWTQCLNFLFGLWSTCGHGAPTSPTSSSSGYGRVTFVASEEKLIRAKLGFRVFSGKTERPSKVRSHSPYETSSSSVPHILANTLITSGSALISQAYCSCPAP